MNIKRIETEFTFGDVYTLFTQACKIALDNQCDNVVFEFNGGFFSVSRSSYWSEDVEKKLQTFPRRQGEVNL